MPQIIPIKELKNTANISEMCRVAQEPIFVTKNGYGDMVIMNQRVYDEMQGKIELATILNAATDSYDRGTETFDGNTVFQSMRSKYESQI